MDGKRAENIFLSVLVALSKSQMVCALCIFVCNIYETENHSFDFAAMRGGVGVRHISAQSPKKGLRGGREGVANRRFQSLLQKSVNGARCHHNKKKVAHKKVLNRRWLSSLAQFIAVV
jgi:hypothetical protein